MDESEQPAPNVPAGPSDAQRVHVPPDDPDVPDDILQLEEKILEDIFQRREIS